jgi:hypothetical protein
VSHKPEDHRVPDAINQFAKDYGPIGFGVIALILLWKVIVAPELTAQRATSTIQTATLESASEELRQTAASLRLTAETQRETANTMRQTSNALTETVRAIAVLQQGADR